MPCFAVLRQLLCDNRNGYFLCFLFFCPQVFAVGSRGEGDWIFAMFCWCRQNSVSFALSLLLREWKCFSEEILPGPQNQHGFKTSNQDIRRTFGWLCSRRLPVTVNNHSSLLEFFCNSSPFCYFLFGHPSLECFTNTNGSTWSGLPSCRLCSDNWKS